MWLWGHITVNPSFITCSTWSRSLEQSWWCLLSTPNSISFFISQKRVFFFFHRGRDFVLVDMWLGQCSLNSTATILALMSAGAVWSFPKKSRYGESGWTHKDWQGCSRIDSALSFCLFTGLMDEVSLEAFILCQPIFHRMKSLLKGLECSSNSGAVLIDDGH